MPELVSILSLVHTIKPLQLAKAMQNVLENVVARNTQSGAIKRKCDRLNILVCRWQVGSLYGFEPAGLMATEIVYSPLSLWTHTRYRKLHMAVTMWCLIS